MSTHLLLPAMVLGGVVISSLGAATTHFMEEKEPSVKTVARDFIIGAVMMLMILQLLPESSEYMISVVMSLAPLSLFTATKSGATQVGGDDSEMEVKVGVPNF
jgi:RsiW-degrading membrane proteinase PrsW (M82 family)